MYAYMDKFVAVLLKDISRTQLLPKYKISKLLTVGVIFTTQLRSNRC